MYECKYRAKSKYGNGYCYSNNIKFIIDHAETYCGNDFELYVNGIKVDNPQEYLKRHTPKTLESKIVDMRKKNDDLQQRIDEAIEMIDLIIPKLWNINNAMTYKLKNIRRTLKGSDEMLVTKKIDNLGRIVIPSEMRDKLDVENGEAVNIELVDNKIIITNPEDSDPFLVYLNGLSLNHNNVELHSTIVNEYKRIKGLK